MSIVADARRYSGGEGLWPRRLKGVVPISLPRMRDEAGDRRCAATGLSLRMVDEGRRERAG